MLKMPSFDTKTRPETFDTFVPLVHCVIDDTLSQTMPDLSQTLFQFMRCHELECHQCFRASIRAKEERFSI